MTQLVDQQEPMLSDEEAAQSQHDPLASSHDSSPPTINIDHLSPVERLLLEGVYALGRNSDQVAISQQAVQNLLGNLSQCLLNSSAKPPLPHVQPPRHFDG